jgi:hypothetical protein
MAEGTRGPPARLTPREELLFEAGVKLGGIFHQYLGIPVTSATAPGLARTIEAAVRLQPYVADVHVAIHVGGPVRGGPRRFRYRYLTAEMLDARVVLRGRGVEVRARLKYRPRLAYPLMEVDTIRGSVARRHAPVHRRRPLRSALRSARR